MNTKNTNSSENASKLACKHSPGPWEATHSAIYADVNGGGSGNRVQIATAHAIATNHGADSANARLIAAAPELLEACEFALTYAEEMGAGGLVEELRAAIAKAKGTEFPDMPRLKPITTQLAPAPTH